MNKYQMIVKETASYTVEVIAESEDEAREMVENGRGEYEKFDCESKEIGEPELIERDYIEEDYDTYW